MIEVMVFILECVVVPFIVGGVSGAVVTLALYKLGEWYE